MDIQNRASEILREAIRRPPEERVAFLQTACGTDSELQGLLQTLLQVTAEDSPTAPVWPMPADGDHDGDQATALMGSGAAPSNAALAPRATSRPADRFEAPRTTRVLYSEDLSGQRIGPYELIRRIGKGGMGTVYAARRADQEFRKLVAVKLVKPGMESEEILHRFKQERQVLAGLDHPNIARLLDGGTEHGTPYLVMEYVEGTAIDVYCRGQQLSLADKLNLFVTVCSAVQYAHQSLVVHRDLKPANIMVSNEGIPKLLDFGIAKVLNPESSDQYLMTSASEKPMTPDYASPEQVRGDPITTASDVYALGVLLYELLTGSHPLRAAYKLVGLQKAVLETNPERPSELVRKVAKLDAGAPDKGPSDKKKLAESLRGDLDCIVLMSLRKEANRRYASVQHLADDLQRYLQGLPVRAHADSAGYRVRKFVHRHTAGVAAGVAIAVALLASLLISLIFYHRANFERQRAEARFDDVRQLAGYVLFDFDNVMALGITPARKALIEKATEYLGRLEKDRGKDPTIEQELVRGYLKIGDLRGNLYGPNLGDRDGARRSYQKALSLLEVGSGKANSVLLAQTQMRLADLVSQERNPKDAVPLYERASSVLEKAPPQAKIEAKRALVEVLPKLAFAQSEAGMPERAVASYEKALGVLRELTKSAGGDAAEASRLRRLAARSELRMGEVRTRMGKTEQGLEEMRRGIAKYEELAAAAPQSAAAQRPVATASGLTGDVLKLAGRHAEAAQSYRKALSVTEGLVALDPMNAQYQRDVSTYLGRLGEALGRSGQAAEGRAATQRVLAILQPQASKDEATEFDLHQYSWILLTTPFADLRNPAEALRAADRLVELTKGTDPRRLDLLARAYAATGQYERARETEQKALDLLPRGEASDLREDLQRQLREFAAKRLR